MSLVMKLQLYVQQVNTALEETSQQVLASFPKIMRDTKSLQEEARLLKEKMAAFKEEILKIEQDTGKSINSIEKLDRIKNQLMDAKQGLHESDNWTILCKFILFYCRVFSAINQGIKKSVESVSNILYNLNVYKVMKKIFTELGNFCKWNSPFLLLEKRFKSQLQVFMKTSNI